ncbi:MAG: hypothetical protein FJX23_03475 [Alphaproteobacteria bacterium]|nr:hypothetical protein [Alphaproteobacteria bacterium]
MSTVSEHLQGNLILPQKAKQPTLKTAVELSAKPTVADTMVGKDGFGFGDLIDVINPLQHIPGVSTVYRAVTGDEMGAAAKIAGAALFGGPIGAGIAAATSLIEVATGADPVQSAIDAVTEGGETPALVPTPPPASTPTVLTSDHSVAQEVAQAAIENRVAIPDTEKSEEELAAEAAAALGKSNAFRLGIDVLPVEGKAAQAAEALADSVRPQVGISLHPDVSDVAARALGANSLQHQIYRQVQTIDPLYTAALDMRG